MHTRQELEAASERFLAVGLAFGKAFKSEEAALAWLAAQQLPQFIVSLDLHRKQFPVHVVELMLPEARLPGSLR